MLEFTIYDWCSCKSFDICESKKMKKEYKIVALLIWTAVLQLILISLILIRSGQDHDHIYKNMKLTDQDLCVLCDQVQLNEDKPDDIPDTIAKQKVPKSTRIECCGPPSVILRRMVLKKLQEKNDRLVQGSDNEGEANCSPVQAAQMNGITATTSVDKHKMHWKTSAPSFVKGGVRYTDGRIIVPSAGHYFVYFQLKHYCEPATGEFSNKAPYVNEFERDNIQTDYLFRYSSKDGHTRIALKKSKLNCKSDFAEDRSTSFVGAVLYLNEHDELFVNTSCPDNQEKSTEGNYFGLFISYEVP